MKRIWIGIAFLAGLLVIGMIVTQITNRQMTQISKTLQQAAETENWETATVLGQQAHQEWEEKWHLMSTLADHTDIDTIDETFAQLAVYRHHRDTTAHAALCAQLSEAIHSLKENHRLTWWNLL